MASINSARSERLKAVQLEKRALRTVDSWIEAIQRWERTQLSRKNRIPDEKDARAYATLYAGLNNAVQAHARVAAAMLETISITVS